ncbi:MAG: hypothetical protein DRJ31_07315 [Candidatus Methanomethylicota archaeon]|uniref:Uncharacterized protein n=1 Tax=Thermoproteota archaeon TaxID=2056631 RepID=A0A497EMI0_9CREN|nr:MAG: hypothetical protein DRJ31_07315 [Candidatus Verstraetearchaeota archaeon]
MLPQKRGVRKSAESCARASLIRLPGTKITGGRRFEIIDSGFATKRKSGLAHLISEALYFALSFPSRGNRCGTYLDADYVWWIKATMLPYPVPTAVD